MMKNRALSVLFMSGSRLENGNAERVKHAIQVMLD
jgi:hypothetical protein